jgi:hypothetical protein
MSLTSYQAAPPRGLIMATRITKSNSKMILADKSDSVIISRHAAAAAVPSFERLEQNSCRKFQGSGKNPGGDAHRKVNRQGAN